MRAAEFLRGKNVSGASQKIASIDEPAIFAKLESRPFGTRVAGIR
jgi:hypothetical protein